MIMGKIDSFFCQLRYKNSEAKGWLREDCKGVSKSSYGQKQSLLARLKSLRFRILKRF